MRSREKQREGEGEGEIGRGGGERDRIHAHPHTTHITHMMKALLELKGMPLALSRTLTSL